MKNLSPKRNYSQEDRSGSSRDDTRRTNDYAYKAFTKDRRTRDNGSADGERPRSGPHADDSQRPRRSYNPNFTADNRPASSYKKPSGGHDRGRRYDNTEQTHPHGGSEPTGHREERPRGTYGQNDGNRPRYGARDGSQKKPYHSGFQRTGEYGGPRKPSSGPGSYKPRRTDDTGQQPRGNFGDSRGERPRPPHGQGQQPYKRGYGNRPDFSADKRYGQGKNDGQKRKRAPRRGAPGEYPTYPAPEISDAIRLNRYVAMSGVCSRREADSYIQAGVISVNGKIVTELGTKVSEGDEVRFNDEPVKCEKKVYIVMNKPKGFVTSLDDPNAEKTVMDLLKNGCRERVYPVGRLDKNSVGVLLITNDGDLAKKLTHPSHEKKKVYQVTLDRDVTEEDMERIAKGITLEDGEIYADAISYVSDKKNEVGVEIHSGRNRIVRRIFEHLGYRVKKLDRVYFAGLTKQRLRRGAWRHLTPQEVAILKSGRYE